MEAYFDNSATTAVCKEAADAAYDVMTNTWGNPSSLHEKGLEAKAVLRASRSAVASKLGCTPEEIIFTSGGTESNNTALIGAAHALKHSGKRIVSTAVEHPSVYQTLTSLENEGFEVIRLPVDEYGRISEDDLYEAVNKDTVLVSIMAVNNEVGTIQPVKAAKSAVKRAGAPALIHCDAVQAFGKMPIRVSALGVDLMSVSSHKIHGPKGVGALYIRKGVRLAPRTFGGEQEERIRPGTEPLPAIAGFGAACKALPDIRAELEQVTEIRDYMVSVLSKIDGVVINSPADALPFITNISVLGKKSEPMLNFLSSKGVYVSAGSACSKGKSSGVLAAMGLSRERLESPLRISFSRYTTKEETDYLAECIREGQAAIRSK